ncbi:MAG: hypothetical protein LC754_09825 [Acidobacteria bacterium]|nr:hypothetical protein [Acidobacteriota bacterium]
MAMKKGNRPHKHYTGRKKGNTAEVSARLAPLEEVKATAAVRKPENNGGAIRVDSNQVTLSKDFAEEDRGAAGVFHLEPVALVIVVLALAFMAFIAWQITLMPSK